MNEDKSRDNQENKSWLNKISQVFSSEPKGKDDILAFLQEAQDNQLLDSVAYNIIQGALAVTDMKVREIMVPRPQMVVVKASQSPEEFLPTITQSGHSRFPVVGENYDEILGILLAKDLLPLLLNSNLQKFRIKDILRPATVIPESKRLSTLLDEFRSNRNHMALVIDEYGGVSGLVTIEDVLEEIVGEIEDEYDFDADDALIREMDDGCCIVNALTPIDEFNEHFDLEFSDDEFDTIGGIVMQHFGKLPEPREAIDIAGLKFVVLTSDNRRIRSLQISPGTGTTSID